MRQYPVFDTASQNEALINEFKGNLFEYLVGVKLAQAIHAEADFLQSIEPQLLTRLRAYEDWLWQHDSDLATQLPRLAEAACKELKAKLGDSYSGVRVIGKLAGGSHDDSFGEADLLLLKDGAVAFPISLKLCRRGAYVNTKSAGVRSFLSKYFSLKLDQERLNHLLDESFSELAQTLHMRHGLGEQTSFGDEWKDAGLPVLPGELNSEDQKLLHEHYARVIAVIYEAVEKELRTNRSELIQSLAALLGFQNSKLIQMTCFHHDEKSQRYQLDRLHIVSGQERLGGLSEMSLLAPKPEQASFTLAFSWGNLQIRVKPMNKFIQAAMKVNCSVREEF